MMVMSIEDFHKGAPRNATHVLERDNVFQYASFTGFNYDSCDNSTCGEAYINPEAANNDWFFVVGKGDWKVHLTL